MPVNRHLYFLVAFVLILCASISPDAVELQTRAASPPPASSYDAANVMAMVRSMLPASPVVIKGRLLAAERVGRPDPVCMVEIMLALDGDPPVAAYSIMDLFGELLEEMTVVRKPDSDAEIRFCRGKPLHPAPAPAMGEAIRGTDITWNDLTLSFLWWRDGRLVGRESLRGRDCIMVDFMHSGSTRLWIDDKLFMIIQAEEYNAAGNRTRRLSVKNIKKIGDVWMLKDLEVRQYPSMHRTLLRIDEVIQDGAAVESSDE